MRKHLPLLAICLGYFMVIVDATIVNVALPSIGRELGAGVSSLQWVVDAYTVVFAGLLLSAGSLGDRVGARRVFGAGLLVFTVASAVCAAAPSVALLITARVAQGVGAAMLVPSSLALLRASYERPSERARAVGAWGAIAGVGAASGPVLGGLLVGLISWRAVFVVNVPVGALALLLSARHLPVARGRRVRGFDPPGQALAIAALSLVTLGLIEGGDAGWGSPAALVPLAAFVPAALAFLYVERRHRDPMLPLALFRSRTFSGASFVGLAINLGFYGQLFAIVFYFQHVRGYSALVTGLALLPEGAFVAIASAVSGRVTGRVGPRAPMLFGLTLGAAGFAGLIAAGRTTSYALLVPALIAAGFGMALTMPAATAAVIESAPAERAGIASGVLNAARQAGGAVGVALLGTLIAGGSLVSGLHLAMASSACAFAVAAAVTAVAVRPSR
ncbi:MAG TPA: DHA2 family efflux MFS transporter permease subunit [Solirubrobacteraceae bacterium]|nr:DHA2 family efflux MFS transporter permease subunit [Solirubrobacteraceae bacterium]